MFTGHAHSLYVLVSHSYHEAQSINFNRLNLVWVVRKATKSVNKQDSEKKQTSPGTIRVGSLDSLPKAPLAQRIVEVWVY